MRLILKGSNNNDSSNVGQIGIVSIVPGDMPQDKENSNNKQTKNSRWRNFDLLDVSDLRLLLFHRIETAKGLACRHFKDFQVEIVVHVRVLGEAMSGSDHHTFPDDCSTTNLLVVLVERHMPRHRRNGRVLSWWFERNFLRKIKFD